jgi:hypothetical protein
VEVNWMKTKILEIKKKESLYDIALDIGISETSLYRFINNYTNVSDKIKDKIRGYLKRREQENEDNEDYGQHNF